MPTLLMGYNLESCDWSRPGVAGRFLEVVCALHREMQAPCTLFVRAQTLDERPDIFLRARDVCGGLMEFQQATYSGLPLKTVCERADAGCLVYPGGTLREIRSEIDRAGDVMERILGQRPTGLAGPLGCYRGLSDRPDLLEILSRAGIRFTRTWTRNSNDAWPVPFETQPFTYAAQGFPGIMEIPGQGFLGDTLYRFLKADTSRYLMQARKDLDYVGAKGLVWSFAQSDWATMEYDPTVAALHALLDYARRSGFTFQTHGAFCQARSALTVTEPATA